MTLLVDFNTNTFTVRATIVYITSCFGKLRLIYKGLCSDEFDSFRKWHDVLNTSCLSALHSKTTLEQAKNKQTDLKTWSQGIWRGLLLRRASAVWWPPQWGSSGRLVLPPQCRLKPCWQVVQREGVNESQGINRKTLEQNCLHWFNLGGQYKITTRAAGPIVLHNT